MSEDKPKVTGAKADKSQASTSRSTSKSAKRALKERFGDPGLSSLAIDPLPTSRRTRGFAAIANQHVGLVLLPMSLALLAVLRPLVDSGKGALLAMLVGIALAAIVTVLAASGQVRYGILPGVWARPMLGPFGAKAFTLLRALVIATFLGHAAWLAAQSLRWGALCAWPQLMPLDAQVPSAGGESLALIALTLLLFVLAVWKPIAKWAFVPALALVISLAFVPAGASLHLVASGDNLSGTFEAATIAFVWAICLFAIALPSARDARSPTTQAGAVMVATILPWTIGAVIYALATFRGAALSRFFDLTELACARLPFAWLIPHALLVAIAALLPLAQPAVSAVRSCVDEVLPRVAPESRPARGVTAGFLGLGVLLALVARSDRGAPFLTAQLLLALLSASIVVVATADFFLVRRTRLYLDDLYSATGIYRGVLGISPAGLSSMLIAAAVDVSLKVRGELGAVAITFSLAAWIAAQIILGNLERWIMERK